MGHELVAAGIVTGRDVEAAPRCGNLVLTVFSSAADPRLAERLAEEAARVATARCSFSVEDCAGDVHPNGPGRPA